VLPTIAGGMQDEEGGGDDGEGDGSNAPGSNAPGGNAPGANAAGGGVTGIGGTGNPFGGQDTGPGSSQASGFGGTYSGTGSTGAVGSATQTGLDTGQAPSQAQMNTAAQADINTALAGVGMGPTAASGPWGGLSGGLPQSGPGSGQTTADYLGNNWQYGMNQAPGWAGMLGLGLGGLLGGPLIAGLEYMAGRQGMGADYPGGGMNFGPGQNAVGGVGQAPYGTQGQPVTSPASMSSSSYIDPIAALYNQMFGAAMPATATTGAVNSMWGPNDMQASATAPAGASGFSSAMGPTGAPMTSTTPGMTPSGAVGNGATTASPAGAADTGTGGTTPLQALTGLYSQDIPYFQSPDLMSTPEGQAQREQAVEQIRSNYDNARQQLLDSAGGAGTAGESGMLQQQLADLDRQEAADMSGVDQGFIATQGQRMLTAAQMAQQAQALDMSNQLQSLGILQGLDQTQQQNILNLLAAAEQAPGFTQAAGGLASNLLQSALGQQYLANQGFGQLGAAMVQPQSPVTNIYGYNPTASNTGFSAAFPFVAPYSSMTPGTPGFTGRAAGQ